ncbi:unnamed protein product [Macrosiphum euphorbiae]|nr:unnamed protein product [Macrosiphum euphorbiae]
MLEYIGFLHTQEKICNEKVYWKCSESKKLKCKGRVHVVNENIVKFIEHNNHVPNASKVEVKKAISHLKEISSQYTLSTHAVIGEMS